MRSQRVGHDLTTKQQQSNVIVINLSYAYRNLEYVSCEDEDTLTMGLKHKLPTFVQKNTLNFILIWNQLLLKMW